MSLIAEAKEFYRLVKELPRTRNKLIEGSPLLQTLTDVEFARADRGGWLGRLDIYAYRIRNEAKQHVSPAVYDALTTVAVIEPVHHGLWSQRVIEDREDVYRYGEKLFLAGYQLGNANKVEIVGSTVVKALTKADVIDGLGSRVSIARRWSRYQSALAVMRAGVITNHFPRSESIPDGQSLKPEDGPNLSKAIQGFLQTLNLEGL